MKVLFQTRTNLFDAPGGDMIQLLKTKEHLEKLGVEVDVSLEFEPDLSTIKNLKKPFLIKTVSGRGYKLDAND